MKNELEKEFIPYEEALALKELSFNEPCLKFYVDGMMILGLDVENGDTNSKLNGYNPLYVSAPTFSQAFRWFREKYGLHHCIMKMHDYFFDKTLKIHTETYEEAELACLRKLIEIAKNTQDDKL